MIPIKDAVTSAIAFAKSVLDSERTQDMRLEEVEIAKIGPKDVWHITLSMLIDRSQLLMMSNPRREYKTFTVDATSGEVLSMKIRELANAE